MKTFLMAAPLLALGACAAPAVDVQWRSVELPASYLRGAIVLVRCETPDDVLRRICEDRVSAGLAVRGAQPRPAPSPSAAPLPSSGEVSMLAGSPSGAPKAVFSVTLGPSSQSVSPGVSIGIGGFGFGSHSAAGIGVAAPLGGGRVSTGYSAEGRLVDVATNRLMWTARASAPPSSDVEAQIAELARTVLDAAASTGLF